MTRQRKWQIEMEGAGRCRTCGEPGVLKDNGAVSPFCIKHMIYVRERMRAIKGYKKRIKSFSYRLRLEKAPLPSLGKPDYKVDYSE